MVEDDPEERPGEVNWRLFAGYSLIGFGGTALFAAFAMFRIIYTSRRGPPIEHFSVHRPAAIATMILAAVGLALLAPGLRIARVDPRVLDRRPPLSFRDQPNGSAPSPPEQIAGEAVAPEDQLGSRPGSSPGSSG